MVRAMVASDALRVRVNGTLHEVRVPHSRSLLDLLRDDLGLTGTKRGCDDASCGACTVLVDGKPRLSCIALAHLTQGSKVTTIEGTSEPGRLSTLQQALVTEGGLQCGYCTPGMVLAAEALLRRLPNPTEAQVREGLSNNACRCTGYGRIAQAVLRAAEAAT